MTPQELAIIQKLLKSGDLAALLAQAEQELQPKGDNTFECSECGHTLQSDKNKRKCPSCKKNTLCKIKIVEESEEYNTGERKTDAICRREPINTRRVRNFIDSGEAKDDTELFDKKVKFKVSARTKSKFKKINAICAECSKAYEVIPALYRENWICDRCIKGKIRT